PALEDGEGDPEAVGQGGEVDDRLGCENRLEQRAVMEVDARGEPEQHLGDLCSIVRRNHGGISGCANERSIAPRITMGPPRGRSTPEGPGWRQARDLTHRFPARPPLTGPQMIAEAPNTRCLTPSRDTFSIYRFPGLPGAGRLRPAGAKLAN